MAFLIYARSYSFFYGTNNKAGSSTSQLDKEKVAATYLTSLMSLIMR